MQDFRKLRVWEEAHRCALATYALTRSFPRDERYGLTAQMRRSSASVPTNIAEGCGRSSAADLCRFLHIAMGSASTLDYQLILARDLGYVAHEQAAAHAEQVACVKRMLNALLRSIRTKNQVL